ncbi:MAG: hypothetical protein R3D03_13380 [Geminicoccaceae bacterium]
MKKMVELALRHGSRFGVVVYEDLFSGAMHHFNRLRRGSMPDLPANGPCPSTSGPLADGPNEGQDLLLTDAEQEMVVDGARLICASGFVRLAGI